MIPEEDEENDDSEEDEENDDSEEDDENDDSEEDDENDDSEEDDENDDSEEDDENDDSEEDDENDDSEEDDENDDSEEDDENDDSEEDDENDDSEEDDENDDSEEDDENDDSEEDDENDDSEDDENDDSEDDENDDSEDDENDDSEDDENDDSEEDDESDDSEEDDENDDSEEDEESDDSEEDEESDDSEEDEENDDSEDDENDDSEEDDENDDSEEDDENDDSEEDDENDDSEEDDENDDSEDDENDDSEEDEENDDSEEDEEGETSFTFKYREEGTEEWIEVTVEDVEVFLEDLNPDTTYEFVIVTECGEDSLESEMFTFTTTNEGETGEIEGDIENCMSVNSIAVEAISSTKATIVWEYEGQLESPFVLLYRAAGTEEYSEVEVTGSKITLENLKPKTSYEFAVGNECGEEFYISDILNFITTKSDILKPIELEDKLDTIGSKLDLYPNPFETELNLDYTASDKDLINIYVRSLDGRTVYHNSLQVGAGNNRLSLSLPSLPAGIYFVQTISLSSHHSLTQKVVKTLR